MESTSQSAHVLIVEDNELVSSALRILFESVDRRVSIAGSIAETLTVAQLDPAKLVLLDLTLPDGNGLTIVSALLRAGCGAVVALTGHDDPETHARCMEAGCVDVFVKPVPARQLLADSARWLDA